MISLRDAAPDDSAVVFEWRNDEATRAASVSREPVAREDHERWYAGVLANPSRRLYIALEDGERVGLCRFDIDGPDAEVSINLNPEFRGKGYAGRILGGAIERFRAGEGAGIRLTATIRPENAASMRIFAAHGFTATGSEPGLEHFELRD
ncbi:MAG: Acetyltransferase family protein [Rhodoglobus sp.]|jgi:RimJ/RimL family protein N-acetyltransferase|nr:Acetyltransferase family protein [Rhodoglobus sp.]